MGLILLAACLMVACLAVAAAALRRAWSPPLWAVLVAGMLVRGAIVLLADRHTPADVANQFYVIGQDVLHGRDPLITMRKHEWNFLPFSAYLLAGEARLGLPWIYAAKILPVLCDMANIILLGQFVNDAAQRRNSQFLYALAPVAILVSAWHGQIEPIAICLGLSALLLARGQRTVLAGLVLGLAIASKSWPAVFAPGVLLYFPWRCWWRVAAPTALVLAGWALVIPLVLNDSLKTGLTTILGYRSFSGTWGWSGVLSDLNLTRPGYGGPGITSVQNIGTILTGLAILAVLVYFAYVRRRPPQDITAAIILAFLATTAGMGAQYLAWPTALLCAARRPADYVYLALASAWTGLYYLYANPHNSPYASRPWHALQALGIVVIITAVASLPWSRPSASPSGEPSTRPGPTRTRSGPVAWRN